MTPDRVETPVSVDALAHLGSALGELRTAVDAIDEDAPLVELAALAEKLDLILSAGKDARAALTSAIAAEMGTKQADVGGFRITVSGGTDNSQWHSVELFRCLFGDQVIDGRTGEDITGKLTACLPLNGSLAWRKRALRAAGVDPNGWSTSTPSAYRVEVVRMAAPMPHAGDGEAA